MEKKLIVYGASGHGKVIADIAILNGYTDIVFYDDDPLKIKLDNYEVLHSFEGLDDYDLFIAVGDNNTRQKISERSDRQIVTLIHPSAVIAKDVEIGKGVAVMANAVINSGSVIKDGCIINTCASIDHDNTIGEYTHISVNAHTAGTVNIGKRVFVGIGSSLVNNISICDDVVLGAGSVVIKDITEKGTYYGVPAKKK